MGNVFADFLQNSGLYDKVAITKDNVKELIALIGGEVRLSCYCTQCGENRVFSMEPITLKNSEDKDKIRLLSDYIKRFHTLREVALYPGSGKTTNEEWKWNLNCEDVTRIIVFQYICTMENSHRIDYVVCTDSEKMWKIGQYPSVADLTFPELDEYKKVIDKGDLKELRRAIGLYAQEISIGSFVYLRRIFERIIDKAKDLAVANGEVDIDNFKKLHMDERISLLKNYLPSKLVSKAAYYKIVSKGIHELSEDECSIYFPILKEGIFIILRQWEQNRKDDEADAKITASIAGIATKLSK